MDPQEFFTIHGYSFSWYMTGLIQKRLTENKNIPNFQFINLFQ